MFKRLYIFRADDAIIDKYVQYTQEASENDPSHSDEESKEGGTETSDEGEEPLIRQNPKIKGNEPM